MLVLDEPTFGQDAVTWAELATLLVELVDAGAAVVVSTHDTALIDAVADSVLVVSQGRVAEAVAR